MAAKSARQTTNRGASFRGESSSSQPITFRASSPEARQLIEDVARHRGISLSKLAAAVMEDFAAKYIRKVGPQQFADDLRQVDEMEQRNRDRFLAGLDDFLQPAGLVDADDAGDTSSPVPTSTDVSAGSN